MDPVRDMVDRLIALTHHGQFGWTSGTDKETYAVTNQTRHLNFMGNSVIISVILDPIAQWQPVTRVDHLVSHAGWAYYQELFRTTYRADNLLEAIHWSWRRDAQKALENLDPNAQTINISNEKAESAAKELTLQLKKIGDRK